MFDNSSRERTLSLRIMQEDAEAIFSLLSSERDGVFAMGMIPYYALFVQSCQDYMGEVFVPETEAKKIKDIRNHIKAYGDSFGKTKKRIELVDQQQDLLYGSRLRYCLLNAQNAHWNLGTYWTNNHHLVGNTQQLAAFLGIESMNSPETGRKLLELGYQIGSFVSSVRGGLKIIGPNPEIIRNATAIRINNYADFNTNNCNELFADKASKELNLFHLHLLCNMNFVKRIIRPLFANGNMWVFRVEYIVSYYTYRALQRVKNYCANNDDVVLKTYEIERINEIERTGTNLFQTKLRNCMMHYNLENQGVITSERIDNPFYGIIESCLDGMDYLTCLDELHRISDKTIMYLEDHFNCTSVETKCFSCAEKPETIHGV